MPRTPASDDAAALRWDDLNDPSYSDPSLSALEPEPDPDPSDHDADAAAVDGASSGHPARSAAMRAVTVLGAALFAAYSIAWVIGVGSLPLSGPTLLIEVLYQFAEFLAIVSSAVWLVATVVLTRGRLGARAGWFAFGALVLAPWPFIFAVIG
jgi:hypothetical protein